MVPKYFPELFMAAPIVTIRGVVSRNGVGGGGSAGVANGEFLLQMTFTLEAWRIESEELKLAPLLVRYVTTEKELIKFMYRIKRDTIVQLRARVVFDDRPREEYTALLEEYIGIEEADAELVSIAQELQSPITLDLPLFPPLRFLGNSCWGGVAFLQTWAGFQIMPELYAPISSIISDGNISLEINSAERKIETLEDRRFPPSLEQVAAYQFFVKKEESVYRAIMEAVFEKYQKWQEAYGFDESEGMPNIDQPDQLKTLISLEGITLSEKSKDGFAYMGFDFECAWDPEHGFGVAVHKDRVLVVGDSGCVWWAAASDLED